MRNTSDPIKENSNVMNAQGGEKKVMKKILSVALSTAMAFSMFASVAFGDTAVSAQQQFDALKAKGIFTGYPDGTAGLNKEMTRAEFAKVITKLLGLKEITGVYSYNDKNYNAKNWAAPYIEAVTAAGIMEGKNVEKKIFDFNGKVTVEEMAKVLTIALELEVPAETNNSATTWAKGYVQAAINAGLLDSKLNFQSNASRELLVGAAYAIDQAQSLKVTKYEVSEGGKVVTFTISDGETVKVTLDKALEANKETEVKFTYKEKEFTEKVTYVVEAATKVQSASSVNLKEVDVAFDGKVDKATATDKNNYTVDAGSRKVKSVTLLEDGKTARLLLDTTSAGAFTQGTTYKVVVKNVKSSTGTVLPQGEVSFTSADNVLPTVTEVKALGTKVIKVTFSEPVKAPTSSNFQLDGKAFVGNVTLGANEREVILRDYTGSISEGAHKLTTSLVEDYAGLKSLSATTDFTVAVDTEGPKVTEISATLEKVTVTFDEEIDPASLTDESFYWLSGSTKKTGKATQISGNVYEVDFNANGNRLPGYETTLYVNVKDYSGNVNAVKEHKVTASVDLVQPRVLEVSYGSMNANELTVRFDKAVNAADKKYFTIKKGDDTYPVQSVRAIDGTNKVFNVTFYAPLAYGTYNIKVSGLTDTTALKNVLVDYEGTFVAGDTTQPAADAVDANSNTRKVSITLDREMDLATLSNRSNYYVSFKKQNSSVVERIALPSDVQLDVVNTGKSVVLTFPQYIEATPVTFNADGTGTVSKILITGLKSKSGQNVGIVDEPVKTAALALSSVAQKDARTFEVLFNQVIATASTSDFTIGGVYPTSVSIDGKKVTLKTGSDFAGNNTIRVLTGNGIQTYSGNTIVSASDSTTDAVAPKVSLASNSVLDQVNKKIVIPFTANLDTSYQGNDNLGVDAANDLIIKKLGATNTPALSPKIDYTTRIIENNKLEVTFTDNTYTNEYSVQVKKDANFIRSNGKAAAESEVFATTKNKFDDVEAASAKFAEVTAAVKAKATVGGLTFTAKEGGEFAANVTVVTGTAFGVAKDADGDYTITVLANSTNNDVIANLTQEDVPFSASLAAGAQGIDTVGAGNAQFANGSNAKGTVTVALNVASEVSEVKVDGNPVAANNLTVAQDGKSFVIANVDASQVGKNVTAKVQGPSGEEKTITEAITK
ncbi:S-layer homology domain-containing protein [Paenibacillus sp. E222]|uniref:S-layer homology domain-containing protein n=1 Tax=Paenibacillus sp. E222 TaxID=2748863 RepID=UPI0015C60513|nr:S-layer homology domain-containing protein [Paenibacillus sp. E222]QLG38180.1 S-layer homology domain-containing protein [Paenibacillus sp. E222]